MSTRCAVVTGANKGIGFEVCKQLASNGVKVVLTARDEKRGLEALQKLQASGLSELVVFHQLDVADSASIATLAEFIKSHFGKLDILINNAGINGVVADVDALRAAQSEMPEGAQVNWSEIITQTFELTEQCVHTNYYGAKGMVEATMPLLLLSDSPRIVNVSSTLGKLSNISNEWAVGVLSDAESLTEEKIDEVLNEFLKDFKEGSVAAKGWPTFMSAYTVSKVAMSAYTRVLAKKYPTVVVNCVCPGYVKTDINLNTGTIAVEDGAESLMRLAMLPNGSASGLFYIRNEVSPF